MGKSILIDVEPDYLIKDLKEKIYDKEGVPVNHQRLLFGSKELDDRLSLKDYEIESESIVYMVMRLPGGRSYLSATACRVTD